MERGHQVSQWDIRSHKWSKHFDHVWVTPTKKLAKMLKFIDPFYPFYHWLVVLFTISHCLRWSLQIIHLKPMGYAHRPEVFVVRLATSLSDLCGRHLHHAGWPTGVGHDVDLFSSWGVGGFAGRPDVDGTATKFFRWIFEWDSLKKLPYEWISLSIIPRWRHCWIFFFVSQDFTMESGSVIHRVWNLSLLATHFARDAYEENLRIFSSKPMESNCLSLFDGRQRQPSAWRMLKLSLQSRSSDRNCEKNAPGSKFEVGWGSKNSCCVWDW